MNNYTKRLPKYYSIVLLNLLNTNKSTRLSITDFIESAGNGDLKYSAGKILSLVFMNILNDERARELYETIIKHCGANEDGCLIDKSQVDASYFHRKAFISAMNSKYDIGKWEPVALGWNIKEEVEVLGLPYDQRGFSTDVFARIKTLGDKSEIAEFSLYKNKNEFLLRDYPTTVRSMVFLNRIPEHIYEEILDLYEEVRRIKHKPSKKSLKRLQEIDSRIKELENSYTSDIPVDIDDEKANLIQNKIHKEAMKYYSDEIRNIALRLVRRDTSLIEEINNKLGIDISKQITTGVYDRTLQSLVKHHGDLDWDTFVNYFKEASGNSLESAQKLGMILATGIFVSGDQYNKASKYFLSLRINSYKHTESIRDFIFENENAKDGIMKAIGIYLPIKQILDGNETFLIGRFVFDSTVAKKIFGTNNFQELEEVLKPTDEPPPPFITYEISYNETTISVASILARQSGVGYGTSWDIEMKIHQELFDSIKQTNESLGYLQEQYTSLLNTIILEYLTA